MSSWYVWTAMGMYPLFPGRSELVLTSPLFPRIVLRRAGGPTITIQAQAADSAEYIRGLEVNGAPSTRSWLPASFVRDGGTLDFDLAAAPDPTWGRSRPDVPPSFGPEG